MFAASIERQRSEHYLRLNFTSADSGFSRFTGICDFQLYLRARPYGSRPLASSSEVSRTPCGEFLRSTQLVSAPEFLYLAIPARRSMPASNPIFSLAKLMSH